MIPAHILKQPGGVVESRLPEGAMQATLRAYSSVIKGAADIGGQFVQFAEEQQDMRNKHDLLEGELSIKDAAADARARMMEEPDASKWTGIYEKRMKEAGDMLRGKGYAPVVHERLSEAYTRTLGTGKIQVASEALKENRRSAQAMGMVAIEKARQSSSWDEADAQAEELHRQGLLDEADVEKVKMANEGYREAERHQMELEADPVAYLDRLRNHSENYPKLSKIKAAKMLERAERAVAQGKAAELDMLEEGVKAGRIDEMLDVPVHELKYMDVKDLEAFEKGLRRSTPPTDEEYSVAAQMIDNLEGMRKDGTEEAELAKAASDVDRYLSAIGPKGDVKWLRERLNDVNPNRAAKAEATAKYNEAQKRAWKEATALTKDHFARGTFGEVTDDEDLPVIETGVKRRAMEDKMRAWIESEENPTPEQVKQKMGRLLGAEDEKDLVKKRLETSPLSKPKARRYGQNLENLLDKYGEKPQAQPTGDNGQPMNITLNLPEPMRPHAQSFQKYGEKYGVDPRFLAAISMLETAKGTSSAYRNKNNLMGVSDSKGPISFANAEASVERMARVLADPNGPYRNAKTLGEIAAIYAPPGAGNDPKGTNGYWPSGVRKYLQQQGVTNPDEITLVKR